MNEREFETRLKAMEVPPPRPEKVDDALAAARRAFVAARPATAAHRGRRSIAAVCGVVGLAAAVALAVLLSRDTPGPGPGAHSVQEHRDRLFSAKDWRRIITEVQDLFPERLQAVVATGDELDVRLRDERRQTSDQLILVALEAPDGAAVELVSFSGEVIEAEVGDSRVSFELLVTASNDVLLAGDQFFWTPRESAGLDALSVRAWRLENGS